MNIEPQFIKSRIMRNLGNIYMCGTPFVISRTDLTESFKYTFLLFIDLDRKLLRSVCWSPSQLFTKQSLESAVACWEWISAARPDIELQVQ